MYDGAIPFRGLGDATLPSASCLGPIMRARRWYYIVKIWCMRIRRGRLHVTRPTSEEATSGPRPWASDHSSGRCAWWQPRKSAVRRPATGPGSLPSHLLTVITGQTLRERGQKALPPIDYRSVTGGNGSGRVDTSRLARLPGSRGCHRVSSATLAPGSGKPFSPNSCTGRLRIGTKE